MSLLDRVKRLFGGTKGEPTPVDAAPGWEAIDAALKAVYGDAQPQHWGTIIKFMLGGPDPLDGVSAYRNDAAPAHWHYVGYGLSELYAKDEANDAAVSGFGFELTFRLRRGEELQAPVWPVNFLQNLARYVFDTGNTFEPGHRIDCNGPILAGSDTQLVTVLFVRDPQLPPLETPHGKLAFVQVVGLTRDEYDLCRAWNADSFTAVLARGNPLLVTDVARPSLLADETLKRELLDAQAREGSSSDGVYGTVSWTREDGRVVVTIARGLAKELPLYLRGRLPHGRTFTLFGNAQWIAFARGDANAIDIDGGALNVTLTAESVTAFLEQLPSGTGTFVLDDLGITLVVV